MKLRTFVKIAITTSVALLCTGFVVFSFFKLSAAENKEDFELYALVPPTATVVFVAVQGFFCLIENRHKQLLSLRIPVLS